MSKRRRTSSIASSRDCDSLDGTGNGDSAGSGVRKRRKKQDPMELVQQVYDSIRQQRKQDGTLLCDAFIRIPKRRQAPLYYELVRHPLDLLRVQQKLKTDEYSDIDDLQVDIELIVSNAKQFHRKTSQEYRDACDLLALFYLNKGKIIDGGKQLQSASAERSSTSLRATSRPASSNTAKVVGRRSLSSLLQQRHQQRQQLRRGRASARGNINTVHMRARRSLPNHHNHRHNNHSTSKQRQVDFDDDDDDDDCEDKDEVVDEDDEDDDSDDNDAVRREPRQRQSARSRLQSLPPDSTSSTSSTAANDETSTNPPSNVFEELFTTIMTATDMDGEALHTDFQLLPSRRKYPKYYEFIESPIDLRMIARKIQAHKYRSLNDMERDVQTLARNACVFNEPGSHIYRCAKLLRRIVHQKRMEMEHNGAWRLSQNNSVVTEGRSERIRNRIRGNAMSLSAITAALKDDEEEEAEEEDDDDELDGVEEEEDDEDEQSGKRDENDCIEGCRPDGEHSDAEGSITSNNSTTNSSGPLRNNSNSPKWKLFEAVRSVRSQGGGVLSEPFWRLPSRRFYPDYYREIKNPVSLTQIRRKLTSHLYGTVSEVAGDLTVLFENAKRYNDDNSKLYKDAVKLQKVMQLKVQELLDIDQNFDTDLEPEYKKRGPKPKQPLHNSTGTTLVGGPPRGRPPKDANRIFHQDNANKMLHDGQSGGGLPLKKRLHTIAKFLLDYKKADGRQPLLAFVEKPSKKLYPDYYEVIREPIDFLDIEARIKANRYASECDMVRDFRLMFANCRTYNETNSPLYEDACLLEKVLMERCDSAAATAAAAAVSAAAAAAAAAISVKERNNTTAASVNTSPNQPRDINRVGKGRRMLSPGARRCKSLYDTIREYREPKAQRQLSSIFLKLPSKNDYPDYYEVIARPIDLERIGNKTRAGKYHEVDDICADLVLMFDNACKFNEPDSQVYKDALVLHHLTLQQKRKLKQSEIDGEGLDGSSVPDVQAILQDILLDLFTSVYNHQDEEERCYSDSLAELPEHDPSPNGDPSKRMRGLSLDLIKRRLDSGLYQRLDTFQADVFACLERARRLTLTDSQLFEDAVELQRFFIRRRNEICRDGQVLRSPALKYTLQKLEEDVEDLVTEKRKTETTADTEEDGELAATVAGLPNGPIADDLNVNDSDQTNSSQTPIMAIDTKRSYKVGDFVYLESGPSSSTSITSTTSLKRQLQNNLPSCNIAADNSVKDKGVEPHIVLIERLFTGNNGCKMLYGSKYLRPAETYHVSTRRFLEHEVFKSDTHATAPLTEVVGRCCVLSVKVYFTQRPSGFLDSDIYVLESRYSTRMRSFKKIKIFRDLNNVASIELVARDVPIEPKRVMSVFRERLEKHKDELQELQDCVEQQLSNRVTAPNVIATEMDANSDGLGNETYYEQYTCEGVVLKTGDFVYVVNESGRQMIAQIHSIWTTKDGKEFFRGPWCLPPSEVPPSPTRLFYKQEVFLSTVEDTNPLLSIVGKCSVLHYNEFIACRVTEVPEQDVYICTSMLDEVNKQVKRLPPDDGMMGKVKHQSSEVQEDEVYVFPRILNPPKKVNKTKVVTGYILYSRDVRKTVCLSNPDSNFGEISKIVGNDWRALPTGIKQTWEERALRLNDEAKERDRQLHMSNEDGSNSPATVLPPPDQVFECLWDTCDFQFEDLSDCVEHCIRDRETGGGHVQSYYAQRGQDSELNCMWRGCGRNNKKNVQPFPNMARLTRHVRDMHINKGNGRSVVPEARSKNFKASTKVSSAGALMGHLQQQNTTNNSIVAGQQQQLQSTFGNTASVNLSPITSASGASGSTAKQQQTTVAPQVQYEPMFISVPPRPQRALHSEAYIKYIEGLHAENKFISPWERTLTVTQQDIEQQVSTSAEQQLDESKLQNVMTWLGPYYQQQPFQQNHQEHVLSALWTLRNQLLKDAVGLQKTL